jgi:hypothetical protein
MEQYIPELQQVEENTGAPWLWMVKQFQDDAVCVLREIRGLRLQGGEIPQPPRTPLYLLLRRRPPG